MKKQIASVKNFVRKNQTKILVTTTVVSTALAASMKIGLNQHDKFLKEHDLYDTYYNPEEDD